MDYTLLYTVVEKDGIIKFLTFVHHCMQKKIKKIKEERLLMFLLIDL